MDPFSNFETRAAPLSRITSLVERGFRPAPLPSPYHRQTKPISSANDLPPDSDASIGSGSRAKGHGIVRRTRTWFLICFDNLDLNGKSDPYYMLGWLAKDGNFDGTPLKSSVRLFMSGIFADKLDR